MLLTLVPNPLRWSVGDPHADSSKTSLELSFRSGAPSNVPPSGICQHVFSRHREDVRNVPLTGTAAFGNRPDGGMLGMHWALPSYLPDQTPPAGALHFELLRDRDSGSYAVRVSYVAQTLDQMRQAVQLDLSHPPERTIATIEGARQAPMVVRCRYEVVVCAISYASSKKWTGTDMRSKGASQVVKQLSYVLVKRHRLSISRETRG